MKLESANGVKVLGDEAETGIQFCMRCLGALLCDVSWEEVNKENISLISIYARALCDVCGKDINSGLERRGTIFDRRVFTQPLSSKAERRHSKGQRQSDSNLHFCWVPDD